MITCTRRIHFCSGHRVHGHEGKCRHIHGHNYVAMLTAHADDLDCVGRIIDFSVLKHRVGGWIDREWDHGLILWNEDVLARKAAEALPEQKTFLLPMNPTAENMAQFLLFFVGPKTLSGTGVSLTSVRLWETENCYADASLDEVDQFEGSAGGPRG